MISSLIFMDSFDQNQLNHFYPFHLFDHNQVIAKFTKQPIPSYLPLESHNHSYLQILGLTPNQNSIRATTLDLDSR